MRPPSMSRVTLVLCAWLAGLAFVTTNASAASYYHKGTFVMAGGINSPVGATSPYLNSSATVSFAGGRNINQKLALQAEYTHHWLAIDQNVIQQAQADSVQLSDAHASLWSITLNGVYRLHPDRDIVPWLTAGGGYYKRNLLLTENALIYYPPVWDPWWGWIDGGWGPGEAVVGRRTASAFGFNVGLGVDFGMEGGSSMFIEARYHHAFMDGVAMQLIPVMAGLRW